MSIITKVNIGADGKPLPAGSTEKHVAILLPQIGWMVTPTPFNTAKAAQRTLEEQAKAVTLLGADDWRLADIELLQLCVDRTRHRPAFDPAHFYDIPTAEWIWSSTELAGDSAYAWSVDTSYGYVDSFRRGYRGFGLAARFVGQ